MNKTVLIIVASLLSTAALAQVGDDVSVEGRVEINMLSKYNTVTGHYENRIVSHTGNIFSAKYVYLEEGQQPDFGACFRGDPIEAGELFKKMAAKMNGEGGRFATGIQISVSTNPENNHPMLTISAVTADGQRYNWFPRMRQCKPLSEG